MRRRLWPWVLLGLLLGLPVLAVGAGWILLDGEMLRARVEAAVTQATGRTFTLSGPVRFVPCLVPTVTLEGPSLANHPGGADPALFTAQRVEVQVALLPLLHREIEIRKLSLVSPRLMLERDAAGRPNWLLAPTPRQAVPGGPGRSDPGSAPRGGFSLNIRQVAVTDGTATFRDVRTGLVETLALPQLTLEAQPDDTLQGQAGMVLRGLTLHAQLRGGTLAALLSPQSGPPWPFTIAVTGDGLQAGFDGKLAGGAPQGLLQIAADRLATLAPLLPPSAPLPVAEGITLAASLSPGGPSDMRLGVQRLALPGLAPDLSVGPLEARAAGLGAPLYARGALQLAELGLDWSADLPPIDALRRNGPLSFHALLRGAGLRVLAEGGLPGMRSQGLSARFELTAEDLLPVGVAGRLPLPGLRNLSASARVTGQADGAIRIDRLRLTADQAELQEGQVLLRPGAPVHLEASAALARLDLDAIPLASRPPARDPAADPSAPIPAAAPPSPRRVIPATPLPVAALRQASGTASLRIATLRAGGLDWSGLEAHARLEQGRLTLEPATVTGPGGTLSLTAQADAAQSPPALSVSLRSGAPGLEVAPILAALGQPPLIEGRLELEADLSGQGADLRQWAATLDGPLGLTMVDGRLAGALLDRWGGLRRQVLPNLPANGWVPLRCLAVRLEAQDGVAQVPVLLLDTPLGSAGGAGRIDLRNESLDLRLLPRTRIGRVEVSAPLRVLGTLAAPQPRVDPEAAGAAAAAALGGLAARQGGQAGAVLGSLLGATAGSGPVDCAGPLRAARGGREGPLPAGAAAPDAAAPAAPSSGVPAPRVQDLLRGLLGR
ncbi:AsmA family protein [Roseomonas sp. OT10]|uniref:AsmA family protein n=1 Tax=Roseomonas cutis TaxID=2897332 RepID=UPI001E3C1750|nr:AsmA family protein [Roseomonas sp. OT10]UFN51145.1 AsmA family protein [Roseomonas sp. OT10]